MFLPRLSNGCFWFFSRNASVYWNCIRLRIQTNSQFRLPSPSIVAHRCRLLPLAAYLSGALCLDLVVRNARQKTKAHPWRKTDGVETDVGSVLELLVAKVAKFDKMSVLDFGYLSLDLVDNNIAVLQAEPAI